MGWVKAHMGILRNEAADVLVKNAAEGVPPDDHHRWMSGGGIPTVGKAAEEGLFGERGGCSYWQSDGMAAEGGNELLSTARRKR